MKVLNLIFVIFIISLQNGIPAAAQIPAAGSPTTVHTIPSYPTTPTASPSASTANNKSILAGLLGGIGGGLTLILIGFLLGRKYTIEEARSREFSTARNTIMSNIDINDNISTANFSLNNNNINNNINNNNNVSTTNNISTTNNVSTANNVSTTNNEVISIV